MEQLSADEGYHDQEIAAASPELDVDVRAGNSYVFPLTKHSLGIGAAEFADWVRLSPQLFTW